MSLRLTDFIGNAGQTNFFMEQKTTESSEGIYCLFNGEYGMHSTQEMSIRQRLKKGMDIETAVFMPAQVQGRPRK